MGLALAERAARRGAEVTLVAANVALPAPPGVRRVDVETAAELESALERRVRPRADVLLMAAAPPTSGRSDGRRLEDPPRGQGGIELDLEPTEDILAALGRAPARGADDRRLRRRDRATGSTAPARSSSARAPTRSSSTTSPAPRSASRAPSNEVVIVERRRRAPGAARLQGARSPTRSSTASRRCAAAGLAPNRASESRFAPPTLGMCTNERAEARRVPLQPLQAGHRAARGRRLRARQGAARGGGAPGAREELRARGARPRPTSAPATTRRRRQEFEAVVETHPVNDYAHFCLGRALSKTGETKRARHHLALASNLRPDRDDYRIYRERLALAFSASRSVRSPMRALVQRVSQAAVDVEGERVAQIGPGLLVLLGVSREDTEAEADRLADKVRALRIFDDAEGRMNEPLGRARGPLRQPVHALRRHPQGQPAELRRRRPRRARRAAL